ncbi:hypothetical protein RFI_09426 [Reticulomyxa filosa]|uniref:Uncharacterized protein n=1 Tax=Reticulomyxa filosa TaxID=46433 RepID=X6NP54_RETFI|nr:hypothetical protein RFI_09426 [Reticulomyxa filosa]|eukprot:ETO27708.1 hypothetical protein RFI_09426 [Reticulomyxa filosa]
MFRSKLFSPVNMLAFCAISGFTTLGFQIYKLNSQPTLRWVDTWKEDESPVWECKPVTRTAANYLGAMFPAVPPISEGSKSRNIRVFVPLCGATKDLRAISDHINKMIEHAATTTTATATREAPASNVKSQSKNSTPASSSAIDPVPYNVKVIGVDHNQTALQVFMKRECNGIYDTIVDDFSKTLILTSQNFRLICSDIFAECMPRMILHAEAIYDRDALVALEPAERTAYVRLYDYVLTNSGKILLTVFRYDPKERWSNIKKKAKYLREEIQKTNDPIVKAQLQHEYDTHISPNNYPKIARPPYSLDHSEIATLFQPITHGDSKKVKLLASVKCSESDDPWEKSLPQRLMTDPERTFVDIYLIER